MNKSGLLVLIAVAAGAGGYALVGAMPSILWISCIAAFIVSLGVYFVIHGKPSLAPVLAPLYAIVEGAFLGALTAALDCVLAQMGYAATGGLALQAFVITISILIAMLALYSFRILRPSKTFVSVIKVLTAGIMITYVDVIAIRVLCDDSSGLGYSYEVAVDYRLGHIMAVHRGYAVFDSDYLDSLMGPLDFLGWLTDCINETRSVPVRMGKWIA